MTTKRKEDGNTRSIRWGDGNFYARMGVVREWLLIEEQRMREEGKDRE